MRGPLGALPGYDRTVGTDRERTGTPVFQDRHNRQKGFLSGRDFLPYIELIYEPNSFLFGWSSLRWELFQGNLDLLDDLQLGGFLKNWRGLPFIST